MSASPMGEPPRYTGAGGDLESLVKTHLFIISPNNSGSTFLRRALALSHHVWSLQREGQHMPGFAGPSTRGTGASLIWASSDKWIDLFADPAQFDWARTRRAWYFHAMAHDPDASVLAVASPPFVLQVDQLAEAFPDARFLFMLRDPYAVVEGICRRAERQPIAPGEDIRTVAARHALACFEHQRNNLARFGDRGVFFTYEAMCEAPGDVQAQIAGLVPALTDLQLDRKLKVKSMYDEQLRNMNDDQIVRLSAEDLRVINAVFDAERAVFDAFGYARRG